LIVVASTNGIVSIREAMRVLKGGGSAVDAVETGIRLVEANAEDHTVGYGGYPNLLGQVEVDAGIMDGRDRSAGAVGAMHGFKHPISVARGVMEQLPHVLLVGQGAERFADELGFERCELLTEDVRQAWEKRLRRVMPDEAFRQLADLPDLSRWVEMATDPELAKGTVNYLAQDARGNICAGTSTSGWAWKYPGRLGDTPIIGAGLYADNRYGAAACTGMGEMAIRAGTARSLVQALETGQTLAQAGAQVMADLNNLGGRFRSQMHVLAIDRLGRPAGFSSEQGKTYLVMTDRMQEPEEAARTYIPVQKAWG
jgi:beta-aspartyl-peptidase (threonine type)